MFQITQAKHSMGLKPTSAMPVWHNKFHWVIRTSFRNCSPML
jgi:hypothetical protein